MVELSYIGIYKLAISNTSATVRGKQCFKRRRIARDLLGYPKDRWGLWGVFNAVYGLAKSLKTPCSRPEPCW